MSIPQSSGSWYNQHMALITVNQVTIYIKQLLENSDQLDDLWIEGEISNFKRAASGHCYFTLKDDQSELRSVMWRMQAQRLGWEPEQGDWVEAHGYISVYEKGGYYQFYVDLLQKSGISQLWQRFIQLKEKLEAEGLFAEERKRPLPEWPQRIGVVTSPTGAALQDIINVLSVRYPLVEIVLSPAQVQGAEAPASIIRALESLNQRDDIDLVIIARGGGSLEDLWAFNDEGVARAVAASRVPVISGVGHETDFTICDFCADVRAPTPTAAASIAVPDSSILRQRLHEAQEAIRSITAQTLGMWRETVEREKRAIESHHPRRWLDEMRQRIDTFRRQAEARTRMQLDIRRQLLQSLLLRLQALDTRHVLARGFALVQDTLTGNLITTVGQISNGQQLTITLNDGQALARTEQVIQGGDAP